MEWPPCARATVTYVSAPADELITTTTELCISLSRGLQTRVKLCGIVTNSPFYGVILVIRAARRQFRH